MEKIVLAAASFENEKYYLAEDFQGLPESIKDEVRTICVVLAAKLMCTFIMGFYEEGKLYFETVQNEEMADFDDIGAELEIKRIEREKKELIKSLSLWYLMFKTPEGEKIKEDFMNSVKKVVK